MVLAIVIGLARLEQFKTLSASGEKSWISGPELMMTLALVGLTMVIIGYSAAVDQSGIPAPLAAIAGISAVVVVLDLDVTRVGDLASLSGGLPVFALPQVPFTWETLVIILPMR